MSDTRHQTPDTTTPINLHNWQQRGTWQEIYGLTLLSGPGR